MGRADGRILARAARISESWGQDARDGTSNQPVLAGDESVSERCAFVGPVSQLLAASAAHLRRPPSGGGRRLRAIHRRARRAYNVADSLRPTTGRQGRSTAEARDEALGIGAGFSAPRERSPGPRRFNHICQHRHGGLDGWNIRLTKDCGATATATSTGLTAFARTYTCSREFKSTRCCKPSSTRRTSCSNHCSKRTNRWRTFAATTIGRRRPGCGASSRGISADELRKVRCGKRNVHLEASLEAALQESAARLDNWLAADEKGPSEYAMANEQLVALAAALAELPDGQRTAIELRYLHGCASGVIAARIGRTEIAVAGLLRRGLKQLRELLNDEGDS